MADYNHERYFWLKLNRNFFKRHDIQIIEAMPNGKDYVLFYLKLMVESIDHEGELRFSQTIPYNEEMLATITNTNIDIVRTAIKILTELGMIEILADKTIYMTEVNALIGSQTAGAEKRQLQRQNQQAKLTGATNGRQTGDICPPEKELELEIDIEKDIYKLAKDIKEKEDIKRVYANNFKIELCDLIIESLAKQSFSDKLFKGHPAADFKEFTKHRFDAHILAHLVNKLLVYKDSVDDKQNYILTIIAEDYLGDAE